MADTATPNLPSRDFERTARFYGALGFAETWRDEGWMICRRGNAILEFFFHPDVDPATSWFSCCLRLGDLAGFYALVLAAGVPETPGGWPRAHPPRQEPWGLFGALIDPDGNLVRLVQEQA